MPEGIALVDAPDTDSVGEVDRAAADRVLAAADLWLFVTTASRYADAAAWARLRAARERQVALGIILDRVPPGFAYDIVDHMRELLGPPEPPLFLIPETRLDRQGMLPDDLVAPLRGWLAAVVAGQPAPEQTQQPAPERTQQPAWERETIAVAGEREPAEPAAETADVTAMAADRAAEGETGVVQSSTSNGQPNGRPERPAADIPQGSDVGETVTL
jgi:hypothetical protein